MNHPNPSKEIRAEYGNAFSCDPYLSIPYGTFYQHFILYVILPYNIFMATKIKKTSRLEIRLTPEERQIIERAATLKGSTITQWTARHLLNAAQEDIEQETQLKLTNEAFDAFLKALDEPMPKEMQELLSRDPQWA